MKKRADPSQQPTRAGVVFMILLGVFFLWYAYGKFSQEGLSSTKGAIYLFLGIITPIVGVVAMRKHTRNERYLDAWEKREKRKQDES